MSPMLSMNAVSVLRNEFENLFDPGEAEAMLANWTTRAD